LAAVAEAVDSEAAEAAAVVEVVAASAAEVVVEEAAGAAAAAVVEEDADDDHLKESIRDVSSSTVVFSVAACANQSYDPCRSASGVRDAAGGICPRAAVFQVT
jgi:hypothetical protein